MGSTEMTADTVPAEPGSDTPAPVTPDEERPADRRKLLILLLMLLIFLLLVMVAVGTVITVRKGSRLMPWESLLV